MRRVHIFLVLAVFPLLGMFYYQAPNQGIYTDRSSSVTLGGTSQQLMAANTSRKRVLIQNPCSTTTQGIGATENLFIRFEGLAASTSAGNSIELVACGSYDSGAGPITTGQITVNAATTGHKFIAWEM